MTRPAAQPQRDRRVHRPLRAWIFLFNQHFGKRLLEPRLPAMLLTIGLATATGCEPRRSAPAVPASSDREARLLDRVTTARQRITQPWVVPEERDSPRMRLLSTAPAVTELCWALGLGDQLVGRTRYCEFPPEVMKLPSVGALNDLNVEALLGMQPELILVSGTSQRITERLRQLNLRHESLPDASLEDLFTSIRRLGDLTGRPRTARALAEFIRAELMAVAESLGDAPRWRVLIVTGTLGNPPTAPYVAGNGSFYADLLKLAGQENALRDSSRPFGLLSLEHIVECNPDVVIELDPTGHSRAGGDADALRAWGRVRPRLTAVARGRVHVLVGSQHYLLGPRIIETFAEMCAVLKPRVDAREREIDNPSEGFGDEPAQDHPR